MAEDAIASIFARHQPRTAKSAVPRARAYRQRRRQKPKRNTSSDDDFSESLIPAGFSWAEPAFAEPPVAPSPGRHVVCRHVVCRQAPAPAVCLDPVGPRRDRAGGCRHHHERLVRPIAWIERHRWLAVLCDWGRCRSRRAGHAVMCRRALASPAPRNLSCRLGRVDDDFCLRRYRRHWLCLGQHLRCYGGTGGARDTRRGSGSIGLERRNVGAGSGVPQWRRQVLQGTRGGGRRTSPDPGRCHGVCRADGRPSNQRRHQARRLGHARHAAADERRFRNASPCAAGVAAAGWRHPVDGQPIGDAARRELSLMRRGVGVRGAAYCRGD